MIPSATFEISLNFSIPCILSILAITLMSLPISPSSSLIYPMSWEFEANGIARKSIIATWDIAVISLISYIASRGKWPCFPVVNLHWHFSLTVPPILISILHPSSWMSIIIPTTAPSSKYTTSLGLRYL